MNTVSLFLRWILNWQYNYADGEKMELTKNKTGCKLVTYNLFYFLSEKPRHTFPYPIIPW
ncbi:hypothetical protein ABIE50_003510 [Chitinophaga sp. OAE865]